MEWNCGGSWPQLARAPSGFQLGASDPTVGGVQVPEKPLPEVNFLRQQADQAQTIKLLTAEHADLRKELQAALLRLKPPQKDTRFQAGIIKPRAEACLDVEPTRVQASKDDAAACAAATAAKDRKGPRRSKSAPVASGSGGRKPTGSSNKATEGTTKVLKPRGRFHTSI